MTTEEQLSIANEKIRSLEARLKVAKDALGEAMIPLATFVITEQQKPYMEHCPELKLLISKAHKAVVDALSQEGRETL